MFAAFSKRWTVRLPEPYEPVCQQTRSNTCARRRMVCRRRFPRLPVKLRRTRFGLPGGDDTTDFAALARHIRFSLVPRHSRSTQCSRCVKAPCASLSRSGQSQSFRGFFIQGRSFLRQVQLPLFLLRAPRAYSKDSSIASRTAGCMSSDEKRFHNF